MGPGRRNEAGAVTRQRLRATAEALFAERGIDAVSIRDITGAAGVDVSAIHYHFGSKRDLALAILAQRAEELGARRSVLLDEVEADPDPSLAQVIGALVRPSVAMSADAGPGGASYVRFLNAALAHPDIAPEVAVAFDAHTQRYLAVLARVTPHLDPEVRATRYLFSLALINQVLGSPSRTRDTWLARHAPGAADRLVDELVAYLVAAFGPPSPLDH